MHRLGKYKEAIALYTKAIRKEPKSSTLYSNRAAALLMCELYEECIKDCTVSLELVVPGRPAGEGR